MTRLYFVTFWLTHFSEELGSAPNTLNEELSLKSELIENFLIQALAASSFKRRRIKLMTRAEMSRKKSNRRRAGKARQAIKIRVAILLSRRGAIWF